MYSRNIIMARTPDYEHNKKKRNFRITDVAYKGLQDLARLHSTSVSELLERVGRNHMNKIKFRDSQKSIDK